MSDNDSGGQVSDHRILKRRIAQLEAELRAVR